MLDPLTQRVEDLVLSLYSYFRSSASYRVRIALNWKELNYKYIPIHLIKDGGGQNSEAYRAINPMGHVPALDHDGFLVSESMAIIDYLDSVFPQNRLFPSDPRSRASMMQACELINSGIQPLQNLKVLGYLETRVGLQKVDTDTWVKHWIDSGLTSLERLLEKTAGTYSFGGDVSAADCFVIPQCFASRRFGVKIENFPNLARVEANALQLPAFQKAHPEKQPDFA